MEMDFSTNLREQRLSLPETTKTNLTNYLSSLGHEPTKIWIEDFRHLSLLQEKTNPSFNIKRQPITRHGHGIGKESNRIDFRTVSDHPKRLDDRFSVQHPFTVERCRAAQNLGHDLPYSIRPEKEISLQRCRGKHKSSIYTQRYGARTSTKPDLNG